MSWVQGCDFRHKSQLQESLKLGTYTSISQSRKVGQPRYDCDNPSTIVTHIMNYKFLARFNINEELYLPFLPLSYNYSYFMRYLEIAMIEKQTSQLSLFGSVIQAISLTGIIFLMYYVYGVSLPIQVQLLVHILYCAYGHLST